MLTLRHGPRALAAACLAALASTAHATTGHAAVAAAAPAPPVPPCGGAAAPAVPSHAPEGPLPAVRVWRAGELPPGWAPPACAGWAAESADGRAVVFAVAGRFRHAGGADPLLARAGAFSRQTEIRFWSAGRGRWQKLYRHSAALADPDTAASRPDFSAGELLPGARLHFVQDDVDPLGPVVQELAVRERAPDRVVITTRNEGGARFYGVPVLAAGGLEAYFHVEREAGDLWRYYALTRVRLLVPDAMAPPPEDYLNQGVALFRFLASMPTDAEPPAIPRLAQAAREARERPARD